MASAIVIMLLLWEFFSLFLILPQGCKDLIQECDGLSLFVMVSVHENLNQPANPSTLRAAVEHFKWEEMYR